MLKDMAMWLGPKNKRLPMWLMLSISKDRTEQKWFYFLKSDYVYKKHC